MKKQSKFLQKTVAFWPSSIQIPADDLHQDMVAKLSLVAQRGLKTSNGAELEKLSKACEWLIEGLYQSHFAVPRAPLVLPLSKAAYAQDSNFGIPFGYRPVLRAYKAALDLDFISAVTGNWVKGDKGWITRLRPSGLLLSHFDDLGLRWREVPVPDREAGIYLNPDKGSAHRRLVRRGEHPSVAAMQDSLFKINKFLGDQCISIDRSDIALKAGFSSKSDKRDPDQEDEPMLSARETRKPAMSMQNVFLYRVFAQGSMTKGGRFYGAWWQQVQSEYRRRILINDDITVECDYSGLACTMLYSLKGLTPPSDPYDIGLNYTQNDQRRKLVKKYMNAVLNDSSRRYKLKPEELAVIGLTHSELHERLCKLHAPIAQHFNTGVGVDLQFHDAEMAQEVILRLMAKGEVCLPIHDSFIVRVKAAPLLLQTMEEVFQERFLQSPNIKPEFGYSGTSMGTPRKALLAFKGLTVPEKLQCQMDEFSLIRQFNLSWERQHFSEDEIDARYRAMNIEVSALKDAGMPPIYRHKFFGLPLFMAARP